MLFSSATFICLFLPLALLSFHLLQRRFGLTAAEDSTAGWNNFDSRKTGDLSRFNDLALN